MVIFLHLQDSLTDLVELKVELLHHNVEQLRQRAFKLKFLARQEPEPIFSDTIDVVRSMTCCVKHFSSFSLLLDYRIGQENQKN
jgi:hypothetical protein